MSGQTFFRVIARNFKARNLPAKDTNGLSDPYLHCNFDNFRKFKTETIKNDLNPEWKFQVEFLYDTIYPDKLDKKTLKIECYDKDTFGSDDFIGTASVDLLTIAAGPTKHEITLRDGTKPAGVISFEIVMEQLGDIIVTFKEIQVLSLPSYNDGNCDPYLHYFFGREKDSKHFKSTTVKGQTNPSWKDTEQMAFKATLRQLTNGIIYMQVKHNKRMDLDPDLAHVDIEVSKYLELGTNQGTLVKETLVKPGSSEHAGTFQALICFSGVPKFAQMETGVHNDFGISGGHPLLPNLPVPKSYNPSNAPKVTTPVVTPVATPTPTFVSPVVNPPRPVVTVQPESVTSMTLQPQATVVSAPHSAEVINPSVSYFSSYSPQLELNQPTVSTAPAPLQLKSTILASLAATKLQGSGNLTHSGHVDNSSSVPSTSTSSSSSLPSGWEQKVDPSSGRTFYVDHNTQTTHWSLPSYAVSSSSTSSTTAPSPVSNPSNTSSTSTSNPTYPNSSVINFSTTANISPQTSPTPVPYQNNPYVNTQATSNANFASNPYVTPTPAPSSNPNPVVSNPYVTPIPNVYPSNPSTQYPNYPQQQTQNYPYQYPSNQYGVQQPMLNNQNATVGSYLAAQGFPQFQQIPQQQQSQYPPPNMQYPYNYPHY